MIHPSSPLKILIVEDQQLIAESFTRLLSDSESFEIVGICSNKIEAMRALQLYKLDVVLLDLSLPEYGRDQPGADRGFAILSHIRDQRIAVRTIVLSNFNDYQLIRKAMSLGANGYLLKSTSSIELMKAIRKVGGGEQYLQPEVRDILQQKDPNYLTQVSLEAVQLTSRETQILGLIARGFTDQEIADQIGLKKFTVNEFRSILLRKFEAKNAAELVNKAHEQKLL
ncbi:response regulator [Siphonobacter aquaeclarae]|jgi:two-component system response regulator NreC|uniref:Two component transcriptional regulator, LuxR family n=1 Tax=Siphonobacter aquaeclarae TaxID=563176 RepID=A0A1G9SZM3_9BACT|nr:response regulator transcription factor [Siphonobacter aquaeclarae]MBO9639812.1 response regulator transcription factor [Siphonobacter aquaeclarae]SDM40913.1 two component transcriptional regulator, LuxR family [Siphonobacter aquaeclarae]